MAKKRQHYVPQVYLRSFVDPEPPSDWPPDRPFTPGVWIQDRSLAEAPQRKAPANILWENSLYTLSTDAPDAPWLEDSLGRLEGMYGSVLEVLRSEAELSPEQYGILLVFIGALFGRSPSQLTHWQEQFDRLKEISRSMSDLPPEGFAWEDFQEIGKRSLEWRTSGYADVVGPHGFVLVNESSMPFITADRPVRHLFLHVDESPIRIFPEAVRAKVLPNVEAFLSFVPLSPRLAFVSSPLLLHPDSFYHRTDDVNLVFSFNQHMRNGAQVIVSHVSRPYGDLTEAVITAEAGRGRAAGAGLLIYTSSGRHWIGVTKYAHSNGCHPLHGRISFWPEDPMHLRSVASVFELTEVRIYDEGQQMGGMRDAWLAGVGISDGEPSVIENWPGGVGIWPGPR